MSQFLQDVLKGLQSEPKYLQSKYFYDKKGDKLFAKIMECREYYLTRCELEIFSKQTKKIAGIIINQHPRLDVVELGPGNAVKSVYLLEALYRKNAIDSYFPVDISNNIIRLLKRKLSKKLPEVNIHGLNGEYLDMLTEAKKISDNIKLVLFLGSNIGNIPKDKVVDFCKNLRSNLTAGDLLLIGIDLKKNPRQIRAAYDDSKGYTRKFNLNLLSRINEELGGNFKIKDFEHYATYDPVTGACRSFLVSLKNQQVKVENVVIKFKKDETVYMEISQKYSVEETLEIAHQSGFEPVTYFLDKKKWFADVIWKCS